MFLLLGLLGLMIFAMLIRIGKWRWYADLQDCRNTSCTELIKPLQGIKKGTRNKSGAFICGALAPQPPGSIVVLVLVFMFVLVLALAGML